MSAWGRTGRVTIDGGDRPLPDVRVDDEWIGYLYTPDPNYEGWGARHAATGRCADHLPSRDAAVLWVLRRVDPALWRQERGEVWRVRTYKYARGWHAIDPEDGQCQGCLRDFPSTIARAHDLAARRAATR